MRIFKLLSLLVFINCISMSSSAFAQDPPPTFSFQGSGYGHGVGMSQIGARGQALEGESATSIVNYYYKDVVVAPVKDDYLLRVNIGHQLSAVSVNTQTKSGSLRLISGDVQGLDTSTNSRTFPTKVNLTFGISRSDIVGKAIYANGKIVDLPSGKLWTIRWSGTRNLEGQDSVASVAINGITTKYRYGQIQIKVVKTPLDGYRLEVTNTLRIHDEYLWGIGEMPSSWPAAALQAQGIASRSYALAKVGKYNTSCDCEIYSATRDQSFIGYAKELEPKYGQLWKNAIEATTTDAANGIAILYKAKPISAYFFSSSPGQTESGIDVWTKDVPFVASVPDPWSLDPILNPRYVHWERTVEQNTIAAAFGLPNVATLEIASRNPTGTVGVILGTSAEGVVSQLSGEAFRSKSKLPSAWFDFLP
ncbi:MAG: hypothetical protein F2865_01110 [Actinobacteria bacterium]|nr:hypothetical protein [Actinomycetota bacterium]MSV86456.1 hypothetical protein [Actinomycetota bacterium]MSW67669.1 hypothetical protein [Actinomycetota bacterium]MSX27833.1 hypothetical protein [Actinomycetota bacterium]MSY03165.1 hypothetical protein [Actinomycetota bacterium]